MQINKTMHGIPHEHPTSLDVNKLIALFNQGKFSEMESHARQLTSHFPNDGLSWQAMGVALHQQGQHSAALKPLQQASVLLPNDAQVHNNLANTFVKLGRFSDAEISYRRALELSPKFTEAHFNLGNTLVKLGRQDEAEQSYRESLAIRQDFVEALNGFAIMLIAQGRLAEALALAFHAVKLKTSWENKNVVVQCLREIRFTDTSEELQTIMTPALSEPWGRPTYLVRAAADLIKLNPVIADCIAVLNRAWPKRLSSQELFGSTGISPIANDAVLLALLDATPVCDVELEKMLTMLRHAMLESATTSNPEMTDSSTLFFYGALARQCFINEYVFGWTKDESKKAYELRDSLVADMGNGVPISELILVTVAAYFPLHTLEFSEKLLEATWSDALNKVLSMQVAEPFEEARLRASIPKLTTIENGISLLVQSMYEENPYPRWIKVAPTGNSTSINEFIQQRYPMSSFKPLQKADQANILIAGCGTGQQPIQTAQQFPNAKVLAIDISITSLSYAMRKTQELDLKSISYAQADIMKFDSVNRKFDVIESSGVLHHLADPMAGWKVLLSRLRKGGLMRLGFYSEVARRNIVRAQLLIQEQGWGSTPNDIRSYRQAFMEMDKATEFDHVQESCDFFSISSCRDLLFHVQEHRMTLNEINVFLQKNRLNFLGFEIDQKILNAYQLRFPKDKAATNLSNWHAFENENPNIFLDMYQFWVQKAN